MSNSRTATKPDSTKPKAKPKPKALTAAQIDGVVCDRMDEAIVREVMSGLFVRNIARACRINEQKAQEAIAYRVNLVREQLTA